MTTEEAAVSTPFSNDLVTFTVQKKKNCAIECDVTVDKKLIDKARAKAIRALCKQVVVPGFRKGKAPESQVINHFGDEIEEKTKNILALEAFEECEKLASMPRFKTKDEEPNIRYSFKNFSSDKAELKLFFEGEVEVPQIEPALFKLPAPEDKTVDPAQVDEAVRQALFFFAEWTPVSERPIQEGDFVILDADVIEKEPATPLFRDTRFEVTDKSMSTWMKESLLGKNTGDTLVGVSQPNENAPMEEQALFTPQKVQLTVKKIETPTLPEMNSDLLAKMKVESEEELKNFVKGRLEWEKERKIQENLRDQATKFLLDTYPIGLPVSLLQKELNFRMTQLRSDSEFMQEWEHANEERRRLLANIIAMQAEKALRLHFICQKLAKENKITLFEHELPPLSKDLPREEAEHQREIAMNSLILDKALDYIVANATPHENHDAIAPVKEEATT